MKTRPLTLSVSGLDEHQMLLLSSIVRVLAQQPRFKLRWVTSGGDVTFVALDSSIGQTLANTQTRRSRLFVPVVTQGQKVPPGVDFFLRYPFKSATVAELVDRAVERFETRKESDEEADRFSTTTKRNIQLQSHLGALILQSDRKGEESFSSHDFGAVSINWTSKTARVDGQFKDARQLARRIDSSGRSFRVDSKARPGSSVVYPLAMTLWELGRVSAQRAFMTDHLRGHTLRLKRWPDFSIAPRTQSYVRLFSLLTSKHVSLEFLKAHTNMDAADISEVVSACALCGLMDQQVLQSESPETVRVGQTPGFLSRIRKALGIGGGSARV